MSDWLVELQKSIAGYPTWLVVTCGLIVVSGLLMLLGKVFRLIGGVVLVAAIGAAGWFAYQHYFGEDPGPVPPSSEVRAP